MMILAIDPGTTQSGFVLFDGQRVHKSGVLGNEDLLAGLRVSGKDHRTLAIEMVASYGMPVGREVFETCVWIGRFQQAWHTPEAVRLVYRRDVKKHLCGGGGTNDWTKAKDTHIWQAILDTLGPVGTKKQPGPCYGVTSHARAALAVAVTVAGLYPPTALEMAERGQRELAEFGADA